MVPSHNDKPIEDALLGRASFAVENCQSFLLDI